MERKNLLGLSISLGQYRQFIDNIVQLAKQGTSSYVCISNVHMLVEAYNNREFARTVNQANIVTPDGVPLTWGLKMRYGIRQERIAGSDIFPDLLQQAEIAHLPVFFYGSTPELLNHTQAFLDKAYPHLRVAGTISPPFKPLSKEEEKNHIDRINSSGARIVFVILGCPKQEKWMAAMKGKINAVMIGVGGALPLIVGVQKRAPKWMQNSGLEWSYRLMQEPKRLFRRYAVTNSKFVYLLFKDCFRTRILREA